MPRAYVLMTAMPPTKGHLHLIEFAAELADRAEVIVSTQPSEPYWRERLQAIRDATRDMENVDVHHIHEELPQEPEIATGFWDMWLTFLLRFGLQTDDYIVSSELYGKKLAEISGATFYPYDVNRSIYPSKATDVRRGPRANFDEILPEFQQHMRMTVTIFGAESTGKTTLSRGLSQRVNGHLLFEWARPYLETVGIELTYESMTAIWHGQRALQDHAKYLLDKPFIIQDTDLFSTVGYWDYLANKDIAMLPPLSLFRDAQERRSDLYLVPQSNIPFDADPLRYGGDHREMEDDHWIKLLQDSGCRYRILESSSITDRLVEAQTFIEEWYDQRFTFTYERQGQ